MSTDHELLGARVHGTLWAIIFIANDRAHPNGHVHYPAAFEAEWVSKLPVPIGDDQPPTASVALHEDAAEFERPATRSALHIAYRARPRTRVYEDIGRDNPGAWYALAARHLGRMAGCQRSVTASLYQSRAGDATIGPHRDTWDGAIMQLDGVKRWEIGPGVLGDPGPVVTLTTRPGDVLLIPKGLPHAATTPEVTTEHSVHLSFAIHRESATQQRDA